MNFNFEMGLKYINLESYDKAVECIETAIKEEIEKGNESEATEYRCVLGELYANLGKRNNSANEFVKVLEFCNNTDSLPKQKAIALKYLQSFRSPVEQARQGKHPQNRAFISKKMNKHK